MMIVDYEEEPPIALISEVNDNTTPITMPSDHFLSLSTAAFYGLASPQALRVTGYIHNQPVKVLVDSGSTHNIIQPCIITALNLPQEEISSFPVMVGSGEFLHCRGFCPDVPIHLQKTRFSIPFFVLPAEGADVILGVAWLSTLGPLIADFSIPQITFNVGPASITPKGEPISSPVSPTSVQSLIHKNNIASLHALYFHFEPNSTETSSPTSPPPQPHHHQPTPNLQGYF